jgi:cell division septation protein DedD
MRFCPKCSLKIKGTITQCPICKVELLSCVEEDEMDSRRSGEEPQPQIPITATDAEQPPGENTDSPPAESAARRPDAQATHGKMVDSDAAATINAKLAKLERHLQGIGKTLTLHMGKEEVLTRSLVELESKIKKIERSLHDSVPTASSSVPIPAMGREPDNRLSQGTAVDEKRKRQPSNMSALADASGREPSDQPVPTQDFSYPRHADHEEETSSFFSESPDVFEAPPDSEHQMPGDERFIRAGGERKKSLLIIIPVLCLLVLFLFLVFYYNNLQKQADKKLTITEQISISSIPVETVTSQPVPAGDLQPPEPKPALPDTPLPAPAASPSPLTQDKGIAGSLPSGIPATTPAPVRAAPKGFAVQVGAFKEKANAIDLTSRLTGKGYPAQMALSKPKKLFRVTVGTFESRKEAAAMAAQIQKKEELNTAIIDLGKP